MKMITLKIIKLTSIIKQIIYKFRANRLKTKQKNNNKLESK